MKTYLIREDQLQALKISFGEAKFNLEAKSIVGIYNLLHQLPVNEPKVEEKNKAIKEVKK